MSIVVTYDIPSRHVEFKKAMFQLGYVEKIAHEGNSIYLPNTTLYHQSKIASQAREDAKSVATNLHQKLERCIATQWGPDWAAIWGEPFRQ